ncbi:MAG: AAA family ATPase [Aquificaceae bacterium]
MAIKKLSKEDLLYGYTYTYSTKDVEPGRYFPGQERVKAAFELTLKTEREGYNLYVSGPEGIGRTIYTLTALKDASKSKKVPEDICYVNNFDNPLKPRPLLLPAGLGKAFAQDIDRAIEALKEEIPKAFESKEYEEEVSRITKRVERKREEIIQKLAEEAQKHNLGIVFTPAGIRLLPLVGKRIITEEELYANPRLQESYEKNLSEFEEEFRDFMRSLRELDHSLSDEIWELRNKVASYVVDKVFSRFENKYAPYDGLLEHIKRLKLELVRNADLFLSWHTSKGNIALQRMLEKSLNAFRVNVIVDNSHLDGAPVVFCEVPTFQNLFGRIFYTAEMGVFYADHMSLSAGCLHRARGGYLVLRVRDLLKNPFLWDAFKKVLMHKKIYMPLHPFEDSLLPFVGISPEPLPADFKVILIGDLYLYYLLYNYDPEFRRLFKLKADFDPIVDIKDELIDTFPKILRRIIEEEGLKHLSSDALSELFKYGVELSGSKKKFNMVFGYLMDVAREAQSFAEKDVFIKGEHIRKAIEEKVYRSSLIEEKIRKAIEEGKVILRIEGEEVGQINGLSVIELGDYSFGKPTRITSSIYVGDKGIINIEREVELSGPIHSKGVLILSGYIGRKYGRDMPLHLSCTLTFEQSYDEVEGDSASMAELLAILSAIAHAPLKQYIAVTGSNRPAGQCTACGRHKGKGRRLL